MTGMGHKNHVDADAKSHVSSGMKSHTGPRAQVESKGASVPDPDCTRHVKGATSRAGCEAK